MKELLMITNPVSKLHIQLTPFYTAKQSLSSAEEWHILSPVNGHQQLKENKNTA